VLFEALEGVLGAHRCTEAYWVLCAMSESDEMALWCKGVWLTLFRRVQYQL